MRRSAKGFLMVGCAAVLLLELPVTLPDLAAAWNGPYAEPLAPAALLTGPAGAASSLAGAAVCLELARR